MFKLDSQWRRLARLAGTYSVGAFAVNGLGILLIPLYTAYLTPADYGAVALLTVTCAVLTHGLVNFGYSSLTRFYFAPEYRKVQGVLVFNLFAVTILGAVLMGVGYYAVSGWLGRLVLGGAERLPLVWIYGSVVLLTPVGVYGRTYLRLTERAGAVTVLTVLSTLAGAVGAILLLTVFHAGVYAKAAAAIISQVVLVCGTFFVLLRSADFRVSWIVLKKPLQYGLSASLGGYAHLLTHLGDRYILRLLAPLSSVGFYSFGYRFGEVFNQAYVEPARLASEPAIMKAESEPEQQSRLLEKCAAGYLGLGILAALALSLFSREVVYILARRETFHVAAQVIPWIVWGYILNGLSEYYEISLVISKKVLTRSSVAVLAGLTNVLLNFAFIPQFGFTGAAAATLGTYVFLLVMNAILTRRLNVRLVLPRRYAVLCFAGIAFSLGVPIWADGQPAAFSLAAKMLTLAVFAACVWLSRPDSIKA